MRKEKNRLYNEEGEVVQKMCGKCSEWKPLSQYSKNRTQRRDGHNSHCKECVKIYWSTPNSTTKRIRRRYWRS